VQLAEVYDRQLSRPGRAPRARSRSIALSAFADWLARDAWCEVGLVHLYGRLGATGPMSRRYRRCRRRPAQRRLRAETHVPSGRSRGARRRRHGRARGRPGLWRHAGRIGRLDLLIDLLETQGRHGELADALARRISTTGRGPLRSGAAARRRARALGPRGRGRGAVAWSRRARRRGAPAAGRLRPCAPRRCAPFSPRAARERWSSPAISPAPIRSSRPASSSRPTRDRDYRDGARAAGLLFLGGADGPRPRSSLARRSPAALPEEGLVLRADLGERQTGSTTRSPP